MDRRKFMQLGLAALFTACTRQKGSPTEVDAPNATPTPFNILNEITINATRSGNAIPLPGLGPDFVAYNEIVYIGEVPIQTRLVEGKTVKNAISFIDQYEELIQKLKNEEVLLYAEPYTLETVATAALQNCHALVIGKVSGEPEIFANRHVEGPDLEKYLARSDSGYSLNAQLNSQPDISVYEQLNSHVFKPGDVIVCIKNGQIIHSCIYTTSKTVTGFWNDLGVAPVVCVSKQTALLEKIYPVDNVRIYSQQVEA